MDGGGSWAGAAVAATSLALQVGSIAATAIGTGMKIEEGIGDYNRSMADVRARQTETIVEGNRRIGNTKAEGVMSLNEMARSNAVEAGLIQTQARMAGSAAEAKLGASGVRAVGSAAAAAGQAANMAKAQADNQVAAANAGMAIGGLRLGTSMQDINAQTTLTTNEYQRQLNEQKFKRDELQRNKAGMIAVSAAGGAAGLASSFYTIGTQRSWF